MLARLPRLLRGVFMLDLRVAGCAGQLPDSARLPQERSPGYRARRWQGHSQVRAVIQCTPAKEIVLWAGCHAFTGLGAGFTPFTGQPSCWLRDLYPHSRLWRMVTGQLTKSR